jgi:putative N6-adenine-specific DNA methylase
VDFRVTCRKSRLYHSDAVAERLGRAVDVSGDGGVRQLFVVRLFRDRCEISADSSGAHLHMRGYRQALGKAPLRETLAAALIRASGWRGEKPLMDPMCGAGTIAIEAALMARGVAAGLSVAGRSPRAYAFQNWPGHDAALWRSLVDQAVAASRPRCQVEIVASDRDAGAVRAAIDNAARAGVEHDIQFSRKPLSAAACSSTAGAMVLNPPYGKRMGGSRQLRNLYAALGNVVRSRFTGWTVTMLSSSLMLERASGLAFETVTDTRNGGLAVRIVHAGG